jgi:hypothetical protein
MPPAANARSTTYLNNSIKVPEPACMCAKNEEISKTRYKKMPTNAVVKKMHVEKEGNNGQDHFLLPVRSRVLYAYQNTSAKVARDTCRPRDT